MYRFAVIVFVCTATCLLSVDSLTDPRILDIFYPFETDHGDDGDRPSDDRSVVVSVGSNVPFCALTYNAVYVGYNCPGDPNYASPSISLTDGVILIGSDTKVATKGRWMYRLDSNSWSVCALPSISATVPSHGCPTLSDPTVIRRLWFDFYCAVNTTVTDSRARFNVMFYSDTDAIYAATATPTDRRVTLHEIYIYGGLGKRLYCTAVSYLNYNPTELSAAVRSSSYYFPGIEVIMSPVRTTEIDPNPVQLDFKSTLPITCQQQDGCSGHPINCQLSFPIVVTTADTAARQRLPVEPSKHCTFTYDEADWKPSESRAYKVDAPLEIRAKIDLFLTSPRASKIDFHTTLMTMRNVNGMAYAGIGTDYSVRVGQPRTCLINIGKNAFDSALSCLPEVSTSTWSKVAKVAAPVAIPRAILNAVVVGVVVVYAVKCSTTKRLTKNSWSWTTALPLILSVQLAYGTYTVAVIEGGTARLNCTTTIRSLVDWKYMFDPRIPGRYIVVGGRLIKKYKPRFEFHNNTYTLTIHNVSINESGLYYCVEDKGFGQQHFVQLNVDQPLRKLLEIEDGHSYSNDKQRQVSNAVEGAHSHGNVTTIVVPCVVALVVLVALIVIPIVVFTQRRRPREQGLCIRICDYIRNLLSSTFNAWSLGHSQRPLVSLLYSSKSSSPPC